MSDRRIQRWARVQEVDAGPFCFGRAAPPLVIVRRPVIDSDGSFTGEVWRRVGTGPYRQVEEAEERA